MSLGLLLLPGSLSMNVPDNDLTTLIELSRSDASARAELFDRMHEELKRIARWTPRVGRPGDTLQATVLVNEVFLRLERRFPPPPKDVPESRATFYRTVGLAMRTIIRDHYRAKAAAKRGGGAGAQHLVEPALGGEPGEAAASAEALALEDAMDRLKAYNPRWYDVVLHRYYAGRSIAETADLLNIGTTTVSSDWQLARAWLRREIEGGRAAR